MSRRFKVRPHLIVQIEPSKEAFERDLLLDELMRRRISSDAWRDERPPPYPEPSWRRVPPPPPPPERVWRDVPTHRYPEPRVWADMPSWDPRPTQVMPGWTSRSPPPSQLRRVVVLPSGELAELADTPRGYW